MVVGTREVGAVVGVGNSTGLYSSGLRSSHTPTLPSRNTKWERQLGDLSTAALPHRVRRFRQWYRLRFGYVSSSSIEHGNT